MTPRTRNTGGFTLVEILIVVVILGILAAIVIPQFTNASEDAKYSSLTSQLQTLRSQLELFQVQHNGGYPDLSTNWNQMTMYTNISGTTSTAKDTTNFKYGPYLQSAPKNAFEGSSTVGTAAAGVGWTYSGTTTGIIKAVMSTAKATALNADTTNDVTTY